MFHCSSKQLPGHYLWKKTLLLCLSLFFDVLNCVLSFDSVLLRQKNSTASILGWTIPLKTFADSYSLVHLGGQRSTSVAAAELECCTHPYRCRMVILLPLHVHCVRWSLNPVACSSDLLLAEAQWFCLFCLWALRPSRRTGSGTPGTSWMHGSAASSPGVSTQLCVAVGRV